MSNTRSTYQSGFARSKTRKTGPVQRNLDAMGHVIKAIKRANVMLWWCDTCENYVQRARTVFVPRKGK